MAPPARLLPSHLRPLTPPGVVDAVLIPEVQFKMEGPTGLFAHLERVLEAKGHAVLCVAEGAGQVRVICHRGGLGPHCSPPRRHRCRAAAARCSPQPLNPPFY